MAAHFITYIPKLTKEKHISKLLCKSMLKEFSTSNNSQLIKRNPMPIKVSAIKSDFLIQKVNRDNGIIVEGILIHYISCC
jgi:hypothetical protein